MRIMLLYLLLCGLLLQSVNGSIQGSIQRSTATGRFFNPADTGPQLDYSDDDVWTIGETQSIKWTTTYTSYTIALWQQILPGGPATLGNVIFRTLLRRHRKIAKWVLKILTSPALSRNNLRGRDPVRLGRANLRFRSGLVQRILLVDP